MPSRHRPATQRLLEPQRSARSRVRRARGLVTWLAWALAACPAIAGPDIVVTLGEQDFVDGEMVTVFEYQTAQENEDTSVHGLLGIDGDNGGYTYDETWAFLDYGPQVTGPISSAVLSIGIWEHDSAEGNPVGGGLIDQVAHFWVDGHDLTLTLNDLFEARGGTTGFFTMEYDVYAIELPPWLLPDLEDGKTVVDLRLQNGWGPAIAGPDNSAGLDYAELAITVPEPTGTLGLACGVLALAGLRRAFDRRRGQAGSSPRLERVQRCSSLGFIVFRTDV